MTAILDPTLDLDTLPEVARNLYAAADELEARGWCQGSFESSYGGGVCLVGAINYALFDSPDPGCEWEDIEEVQAVAEHLGMPPGDVPGWNDITGRTADQVIAVLRATALIESAR